VALALQPLAELAAVGVDRFYLFDTYRRWQPGRIPEWFDHRANLYRTLTDRRMYWCERGVYTREVIPKGGSVLDLCSGDGFYPFVFYIDQAARVDAVDWDASAIKHARRHYAHPAITFTQMDVIRSELPPGPFDVVAWNAAIEHFSLEQIAAILRKIAGVLKHDGVLSGYTILTDAPGAHQDHQHEFRDANELSTTLRYVFPHVATLETEYPDRLNIYFRASHSPTALGGWRPG
jgi:2-polyprenyl-3-methyl-5-hydroxy-6-metoxy-1,4-benzoquinol methylase